MYLCKNEYLIRCLVRSTDTSLDLMNPYPGVVGHGHRSDKWDKVSAYFFIFPQVGHVSDKLRLMTDTLWVKIQFSKLQQGKNYYFHPKQDKEVILSN